MKSKLTDEQKLDIYKDVLRGMKQTEVAKKYDIHQSWVSVIYNKTIQRNDRDLAVSAALEFVAEYTRQKDYCTMKLYELEDLLGQTNKLTEKQKIIMDQVTVSQIILNLCSQGKFMQAIQEFGYDHGDEVPKLEKKEK